MHNQRNFGASQDDGITALLFHSAHDTMKVLNRLLFEDSWNQLIHNDAIDFLKLVQARPNIRQPLLCQGDWIDITLNQPACSGKPKAFVTKLFCLRGNNLRDMQPREWQGVLYVRQ